jgi:hypothetical protein
VVFFGAAYVAIPAMRAAATPAPTAWATVLLSTCPAACNEARAAATPALRAAANALLMRDMGFLLDREEAKKKGWNGST